MLQLFLSFSSCSKQDSNQRLFTNNDQKAVEALQKSYGLTVFDQKANETEKDQILEVLAIHSKYFQKLKNKLNTSNIRLFTNSDENTTIAVFSFYDDINKLFAAKGSFLKGKFIISKELIVGKQSESKGNGQVFIFNGDEALVVNSRNGIEDIQQMNIKTAEFRIFQTTDQYGNHGEMDFAKDNLEKVFLLAIKQKKTNFVMVSFHVWQLILNLQ